MADKSFGVKELNLLNASGTPTVTSPNNLNLNANTVAISTSCTIGNNLTVTSTTNSANLNVTGIGTLTRAFATDLSVSGVTTITVPANANPHSSWDVVNNSASAYRFTGPGQDGAEDNPNIYLVRGQRYVFKMNASGHPFQIRVANAGAAYSDGVTNNGSQTGNVVFNVQHDAPAQLFYQCTSHGSMVGNIYIVGGPQVISGVVTATTFVGNLTGNVTGTASGNAVLTGSTNDQLVTVTGANAITGESGLTYNGTTLSVTGNLNQSGSGNIVHYLNTGNNSGDNSTIAFGDSADADAGYINYDHGTNALQIRTNGGSNSLVIGSDGNFGVGTNSPNYKTVIQVSDTTAYSASTISANQFQLAISNSGANGVAGILLATEPSSGNGGHCGIRALSTGNGSSDLTFSTRGSSTSGERLRITSSGNIEMGSGAGTGSDFSLLDGMVINTANGSAGLIINSSSSSHNAYMSFGYGSGSGTSHHDQFSAYIGRVGDNTLILGTNNNIRATLTSDGNFIIGNTSTTDNAHFQHYQSSARHQSFQSTNGDLAIVTDNNTNPAFYIKGTGTADLVNIFDNTKAEVVSKNYRHLEIEVVSTNFGDIETIVVVAESEDVGPIKYYIAPSLDYMIIKSTATLKNDEERVLIISEEPKFSGE